MSRLGCSAHSRQAERRAVTRLVLLPVVAGLVVGVGWAPATHAAVSTLHDFRGDSARVVALKLGNALANDPGSPSDLVKQQIGTSDRCSIADVAIEPIDCSTRLDLTRDSGGFVLTVEGFGHTATFRSAEVSSL